MKKMIAVLMVLMMVLSVAATSVGAADELSAKVYVTIADNNGKPAVALEEITVTDIDADEALTINDALYCAHEKFYDGGAAAGYGTEMTKYGLSLTKLWGTVNGYNYGYTVNAASAWNLADPVKDYDVVDAYVIRDLVNYSDKHTYFDRIMDKELKPGDSVELRLRKTMYDADYKPYEEAGVGVKITIDGEETDLVTGDDGEVTVTFDKAGRHIVSIAQPANEYLFPAVYLAEVVDGTSTPDQLQPGGSSGVVIVDGENDTAPTGSSAGSNVSGKSTGDEATKDQATKDTASNGSAVSSGSTPKTGDETMLWLWITIAAVCLAGAVGAAVFYKKHYAKK